MRIALLVFAGQYVCLEILKLLDIIGYVPDARWCAFSYRTHDFEPFASSCLGHPNRLTLIKLSVIGMSSAGWLGDGDLPM